MSGWVSCSSQRRSDSSSKTSLRSAARSRVPSSAITSGPKCASIRLECGPTWLDHHAGGDVGVHHSDAQLLRNAPIPPTCRCRYRRSARRRTCSWLPLITLFARSLPHPESLLSRRSGSGGKKDSTVSRFTRQTHPATARNGSERYRLARPPLAAKGSDHCVEEAGERGDQDRRRAGSASRARRRWRRAA